MKYILTSNEMREIDTATSESIGVPSSVLMERAALVCAEEIKSSGFDTSRILIVCGMGNNGADGLALARIINRFYKPDVYLVGAYKELKGLPKAQYDSAARSKVKLITDPDFSSYTIIVDAIFGIGLTRALEGIHLDIVKKINESPAKVVAVDIPSGIDATSGQVLGDAVRADLTVSFAYTKLGQVLYPGAEYSGILHVRDIGIYADLCTETSKFMYTYTERDLNLIPKRRRYSNKGSYGRVLAIAGSENMSGAAVLAAKSAYKSGSGLVEVFTHEKIRGVVGSSLPEAILSVYGERPDFGKLYNSVNSASAVLIGPGLSKSKVAESILRYVLESASVPVVIDADALNIISENPELMPYLKGKIITPHLGEMARLTGKGIPEIAENIVEVAKEFARIHECICVLKDARTIVALDDEPVFVNTAGNSGMAKGGSGDTLAGIIVSLLSQGMTKGDAARLGVYLHAYAGDLAASKKGEYALLATDISDAVGSVMERYK